MQRSLAESAVAETAIPELAPELIAPPLQPTASPETEPPRPTEATVAAPTVQRSTAESTPPTVSPALEAAEPFASPTPPSPEPTAETAIASVPPTIQRAEAPDAAIDSTPTSPVEVAIAPPAVETARVPPTQPQLEGAANSPPALPAELLIAESVSDATEPAIARLAMEETISPESSIAEPMGQAIDDQGSVQPQPPLPERAAAEPVAASAEPMMSIESSPAKDFSSQTNLEPTPSPTVQQSSTELELIAVPEMPSTAIAEAPVAAQTAQPELVQPKPEESTVAEPEIEDSSQAVASPPIAELGWSAGEISEGISAQSEPISQSFDAPETTSETVAEALPPAAAIEPASSPAIEPPIQSAPAAPANPIQLKPVQLDHLNNFSSENSVESLDESLAAQVYSPRASAVRAAPAGNSDPGSTCGRR